jgi:hypothetical protein
MGLRLLIALAPPKADEIDSLAARLAFGFIEGRPGH